MKKNDRIVKAISNYESIYALIICVVTMLISLVCIGMIVSDMIALLGMAQNDTANSNKMLEQGYYSSLIGSGTFLVISLFAFALHRPLLNNDR